MVARKTAAAPSAMTLTPSRRGDHTLTLVINPVSTATAKKQKVSSVITTSQLQGAQVALQVVHAARDQPAVVAQLEAVDGELLALAREIDLAGEQLAGRVARRLLHAGDHGHRDRGDAGGVAIEVHVDGVFAGRDAARVGDLVVQPGGVGALAEVV